MPVNAIGDFKLDAFDAVIKVSGTPKIVDKLISKLSYLIGTAIFEH